MMRRLARDLSIAVGELVSPPGGPVFEGPDLPGGSGQEKRLQT